MLTVTIDQSEGISGADIPEQAVKKTRTGSAALSLPAPARFSHFFLLNDFPLPSPSLEQATRCNANQTCKCRMTLVRRESFIMQN